MVMGPFELFNVLTKKYFRMTFWRLSTKIHGALENIRSALDSVDRPGREVHGGTVGPSVWKKRKCAEGGEGYLVRDGACMFLGEVSQGAQGARAAVLVELLPGRVPDELFSRNWFSSILNCVRKRMGVDGVRVLDWDLRTVFVKSRFENGEFRFRLND